MPKSTTWCYENKLWYWVMQSHKIKDIALNVLIEIRHTLKNNKSVISKTLL